VANLKEDMTPYLLIAVGFSVSLLFALLGILWRPVFLDVAPSQESVYYSLAMLPWILSPLWVFLVLAKNVVKSLKNESFFRANLIVFLFLNSLLVTLYFYQLAWKSTEYKIYWSLIATQHVIMLIIWASARQVSASNTTFNAIAEVGSARKENLIELLQNQSQGLLRTVEFDADTKKHIDLLIEEARYLPVYSGQSQFKKLVEAANSWAQSQKDLIKDYQYLNVEQKKLVLDDFKRQTKVMRDKIALTKN
jgi:hypothetical protein